MSRDALTRALLDLAEALVGGYDVAEILDRLCDRVVELLPISGAGVMLLDRSRGASALVTVAASDARIHAIERLQLELGEGPCLQAWQLGEHVIEPDLESTGANRWPEFSARAVTAGMAAVHSFPLRFHDERIGALNLFGEEAGSFSDGDAETAQVLADMATIYVINTRALGASVELTGQLQHALDGRVVIEQAKGRLSQALGVDVDEAFQRLRHRARSKGERLHDLARRVADDTIDLDPQAWPPAPGRPVRLEAPSSGLGAAE